MSSEFFSNEDTDILKEVANIGSGNAATALSLLLNKRVNLDVPRVTFTLLSDVPEELGGAEELKTAIIFKLAGFLNGFMAFIIDEESEIKLCNISAGDYEVDKESVLKEISNIISGAYVNAISNLISKPITLSVPYLGKDMIGSLIDAILSHMYSTCECSLIIKTNLSIENENISGHFILLLEQEDLNKLIKILKVGG